MNNIRIVYDLKSFASLRSINDVKSVFSKKKLVVFKSNCDGFNVKPATAIKEVESAIATAQESGPGLTKVLRQKRLVLDTYLTRLGHYVEDTANDLSVTDDKREGIVVSAGMTIKDQTLHQKQHFEARNTKLSGTVRLLAEGIERGAHEWEFMDDIANFTNRKSADLTTTAHTDIHDLKSGTKYTFFHKEIYPVPKVPGKGLCF